MNFQDLSTEKFRLKMRPHAIKIYQEIFPNCEVIDLRESGGGVHPLDKSYGIDTQIILGSGQTITLQEKYRNYKYYKSYRVDKKCPDFTQEYYNGDGSKGEWFNLSCNLYFYGWATREQDGFIRWILLDVLRYKKIIELNGGLEGLGKLCQNRKHGRASFYAIPCLDLVDAWVGYDGYVKMKDGLLYYESSGGQIEFVPLCDRGNFLFKENA